MDVETLKQETAAGEGEARKLAIPASRYHPVEKSEKSEKGAGARCSDGPALERGQFVTAVSADYPKAEIKVSGGGNGR